MPANEQPKPKQPTAKDWRDATTIERFCKRHEISRSFFYKLAKAGLGPKTMQMGATIRISKLAGKRWRKRMERGDAADFNKKTTEAS